MPATHDLGEFGVAVVVTVTEVFVGAPESAQGSSYGVGAVYVFGSSGGAWFPGPVLKFTTETYGQRFGSAIAVDGALLVGAPDPTTPAAAHPSKPRRGRMPASRGRGGGVNPRFGVSPR
jgi:hypothetical protein